MSQDMSQECTWMHTRKCGTAAAQRRTSRAAPPKIQPYGLSKNGAQRKRNETADPPSLSLTVSVNLGSILQAPRALGWTVRPFAFPSLVLKLIFGALSNGQQWRATPAPTDPEELVRERAN
ncbi:hypothetical protein ColLi_02247 [Colletotrichum liriopes]|uniref:Uncharacterized protein n=1 Tax=Colletotrichum liriopes TaxID=708192 RepID=A0AA37GEF7_9PEZI|nr:hypothetical protein ColLi_02247 [Colletotrichum liriopes]